TSLDRRGRGHCSVERIHFGLNLRSDGGDGCIGIGVLDERDDVVDRSGSAVTDVCRSVSPDMMIFSILL
ncbi:MAG TPA: hypothetical protein VMQ76_06970, partial [Terracidiphilus sp.]|nr:hypothetical protein [Terracidiphilus sp.]